LCVVTGLFRRGREKTRDIYIPYSRIWNDTALTPRSSAQPPTQPPCQKCGSG
jgi:hypothetical protein